MWMYKASLKKQQQKNKKQKNKKKQKKKKTVQANGKIYGAV